ncbi:MAG: hypothetical protein KC493_07295 [Bacteriovoracaceae bacterium]|nr:hypothetical protein [Bacteriovoracaceae bacterium]
MTPLKILSFNLENFFLTSESLAPSRGLVSLKDKNKVKDIARMIIELNPDVCALSEVGGLSSLEHFNKNHLSEKYISICPPGNSDRGIEIGYLIKKELQNSFKHVSHKETELDFIYPNDIIENKKATEKNNPLPFGNQKFSRDLSELQISLGEEQIIIFLVHLKSQWDRRGDDFRGRFHRQAEVKALVDITKSRKKELPNAHIILTGDFNGRVTGSVTDPEFKNLRDQNYTDILKVKDLPETEKYSMIQFNQGVREFVQLDYILVENKTKKFIVKEKSGLVRFKNSNGNQIPLPGSLQERSNLPSDHFPLTLTLQFPM